MWAVKYWYWCLICRNKYPIGLIFVAKELSFIYWILVVSSQKHFPMYLWNYIWIHCSAPMVSMYSVKTILYSITDEMDHYNKYWHWVVLILTLISFFNGFCLSRLYIFLCRSVDQLVEFESPPGLSIAFQLFPNQLKRNWHVCNITLSRPISLNYGLQPCPRPRGCMWQ